MIEDQQSGIAQLGKDRILGFGLRVIVVKMMAITLSQNRVGHTEYSEVVTARADPDHSHDILSIDCNADKKQTREREPDARA